MHTPDLIKVLASCPLGLRLHPDPLAHAFSSLLDIRLFSFKDLFMPMGILPGCMSVARCAKPTKARRGNQIPRELELEPPCRC